MVTTISSRGAEAKAPGWRGPALCSRKSHRLSVCDASSVVKGEQDMWQTAGAARSQRAFEAIVRTANLIRRGMETCWSLVNRGVT